MRQCFDGHQNLRNFSKAMATNVWLVSATHSVHAKLWNAQNPSPNNHLQAAALTKDGMNQKMQASRSTCQTLNNIYIVKP
jgi:hypothetical protein